MKEIFISIMLIIRRCMQNTNNALLVWIDLEMTGLNPAVDTILEIALVVTNGNLETIVPARVLVIHQTLEQLTVMNEWVKNCHTKSGLLNDVSASKITLQQAEDAMIAHLAPYCKNSAPLLCGNTIWQDRAFLKVHMPQLEALFHYRMIDVSSIKELVKRWYPDSAYAHFKKSDTHRASADIYESIAELGHYRTHFFV